MSFRPRRAYAVFWKDILDLRKNLGMLFSMSVLPMMMVIVPTFAVYAYSRDNNDQNLRAVAMFYQPGFPASASAARFLIDKTLVDWFGMFLVMPVFVPILISSQSVAGEKERRTLEPLLASPVTSLELVLGKSFAALVPAIFLTWTAFALLCVSVDLAGWKLAHELLLPNRLWMFGVLVLAPLFAFFGNGVAVLISSRAKDARMAQQLSGLTVLPIVGLAAGQVAGVLNAGLRYYLLQGLVILAFDVLLLVVSIRVFDRERLVSRWG